MATQEAAINRGQAQQANGFHLHHHQTNRARDLAGHAGVAVLRSLAAYADNASGKCYPTIPTIARESRVGRKKAAKVLVQLNAGEVIDRRRRPIAERNHRLGGAFEYTIIPTDGPRGFVPVSLGWMRQHALNPACMDAYALIRSIGNGNWKFKREFDKVRLMLGVPRTTFYRLLDALAERGLVRHYRDAGGHWWELPELQPPDDAPIKRFLAVKQRPSVPFLTTNHGAETAASVPFLTTELYKVKTNTLPNSGVGFELDKPNPRSKPEARRAEKRATEPAECDGSGGFEGRNHKGEFAIRPCRGCQRCHPQPAEILSSDPMPEFRGFDFGGFNFGDIPALPPAPAPRKPAAPAWSKATSGPQRVIRNAMPDDGTYPLYELHDVVLDELGLHNLDPSMWPRINGMLARMPHRTVDEFRDAMIAAVEELKAQQDMRPNSAFYRDSAKTVIWAVGQATGCSLWMN